MLDNIIGQCNTVRILKEELKEKKLPSAILFHGPPFSAKLSTALEIARVLTCEEGHGDWSCTCASCRRQRVLTHPYTLLLGSHYFDIEILASSDVLRRTRKLSAQYLFIRAVRKLTRRYDPIIWEGNESKVRALQPIISEVEERLDLLSPEYSSSPLPEGDELENELERIESLCGKLQKPLSADNIPIDHIRRATYWMHMSTSASTGTGAGGRRKIIILENADKMYDASSNSLLKILEEPPPEVYLILITTRKGAIIPTIRSRIRPYTFVERSSVEAREVLKRIFREDMDEYSSLREYFLFWKDVNPKQLKTLARRFVESIVKARTEKDEEEAANILKEMEPLSSPKLSKEMLTLFFEELLIQLRILLKEDGISTVQLERWNHYIREHNTSLNRFNQNPSLVLESLYYNIRAIS